MKCDTSLASCTSLKCNMCNLCFISISLPSQDPLEYARSSSGQNNFTTNCLVSVCLNEECLLRCKVKPFPGQMPCGHSSPCINTHTKQLQPFPALYWHVYHHMKPHMVRNMCPAEIWALWPLKIWLSSLCIKQRVPCCGKHVVCYHSGRNSGQWFSNWIN